MSKKTVSEQIFENFLSENSISFSPIPTAKTPRPDYSVICGKETILFEIKELSEDADFQSKPLQASTRIVGNHVRSKIVEAGKQIKYGADQGLPSVLLIYNNIDHMHLFGTEDHDFSTAMYGEFSLRVDNATDKLALASSVVDTTSAESQTKDEKKEDKKEQKKQEKAQEKLDKEARKKDDKKERL